MTRFVPRLFPAWVLVLLVLSFAGLQALTLTMASIFAAESTRTADLLRLAERTTSVVRAIAAQPGGPSARFLEEFRSATLAASIDERPAIASPVATNDEHAELEDILLAKLSSYGAKDLRITRHSVRKAGQHSALFSNPDTEAGPVEVGLSELSEDLSHTGEYVASVQLSDGKWLNLASAVSPPPALLALDNIYWYLLFGFCILLLCVWAIVQLTAPYRRLERAVLRIGEDIKAPPIPETGGQELRTVIRALNSMQATLRDYVEEREHLAAALAHDLRTPLTRMKLRCEVPEGEGDLALMEADVRELENIVRSVLDYANESAGGEPVERIELVSLVEAVCDRFPKARVAGNEETREAVVVRGRAVSLQRCFSNLIDNAIRHGGGASVSVEARGGQAELVVEDEGPGIPDDEIGNVLKPFYRLERSRNRQTGGSGLGLAIADRVARRHGGSLTLENRVGGGLRAVLSLPMSVQGSAVAEPALRATPSA